MDEKRRKKIKKNIEKINKEKLEKANLEKSNLEKSINEILLPLLNGLVQGEFKQVKPGPEVTYNTKDTDTDIFFSAVQKEFPKDFPQAFEKEKRIIFSFNPKNKDRSVIDAYMIFLEKLGLNPFFLEINFFNQENSKLQLLTIDRECLSLILDRIATIKENDFQIHKTSFVRNMLLLASSIQTQKEYQRNKLIFDPDFRPQTHVGFRVFGDEPDDFFRAILTEMEEDAENLDRSCITSMNIVRTEKPPQYYLPNASVYTRSAYLSFGLLKNFLNLKLTKIEQKGRITLKLNSGNDSIMKEFQSFWETQDPNVLKHIRITSEGSIKFNIANQTQFNNDVVRCILQVILATPINQRINKKDQFLTLFFALNENFKTNYGGMTKILALFLFNLF
jgi:hypothetical protein